MTRELRVHAPAGGESIDDFLDGFPSVKREQIVAFLEQAKDSLIAQGS